MTVMTAEAAPTAPYRRPWWLTLITGIAAITVGSLLLFGNLNTQVKTYFLLVQLLGIWWFVDGIFDIVSIFIDRTGWVWKLIMGVISIIAGGAIMTYPVVAGLQLPQIFVLVLGLWGLLKGILLLVLAFRGAGVGAGVLGVITIIFGGILVANYSTPGWGLSLVWVGAIFGFLGGFVLVFRAFQERRAI